MIRDSIKGNNDEKNRDSVYKAFDRGRSEPLL